MNYRPLQPGDIGILQNLKRSALNGLVAEVTGGLKRRILYSLSNSADSEICPAYRVRVCGYPQVNARIEWCVKVHQIRPIDDPDGANEVMSNHMETNSV